MQEGMLVDGDTYGLTWTGTDGRARAVRHTNPKPPACPYPANTAEAALWQRRAECEWALTGLRSFVDMGQRAIDDAIAKKAESESNLASTEAEIAAIDVALAKLAAGA